MHKKFICWLVNVYIIKIFHMQKTNIHHQYHIPLFSSIPFNINFKPTLKRRQVHILQVSMGHCNQPPYHRKTQPRQYKTQREYNQRPSPLGVDQCCEDVLKKTYTTLRNFLLCHIAVTEIRFYN